MRLWIIALIITLLLCSSVFAYERDLQLGADGRVEINSYVHNRHLWTGLDVYGDGVLNYEGTNRLNIDTLDTSYNLEIGAAHRTLIPMRAITATGGVGDYALLVAPKAGEVATLGIRYQHDAPVPEFDDLMAPEPGSSVFTFSELAITAQAQMSDGLFRSHLSLESPVIMAGAHEDIRIRGQVYFQDTVTFDKLNEVEIQIPEQ